ncbi:hypothetical protein [Ferruginibacter sp.]|nr:hypothetical protein [Ferruginibacter sp.]
MKKIILGALLLVTVITVNAQNEEEKDGKKKLFKKENLFTGGSVTVSFFSGGTVLGLSPYFGYSLNKYIDVAVSANVNYTSIRDAYYSGDKSRQTVIGPGAFVRLYPVKFIFAQAQFEQSFIKEKYIYPSNLAFPTETTSYNVSSFLVGGGYCNGREGTGDVFYYFSVMWDLKKDINSPYVDGLGRTVPIIRAGLNIPLFQGGKNRR